LLGCSAADAEDLVAEAIARSLPRWRTGQVGDVSAYVRRVTVNLASSRWRRRSLGRRRDHYALDWLPADRDPGSNLAERDLVLRAVMRLPVRRRAVVVLRFYDDLSESQIADVLDVKVGTVKSQLSRALEQLRGDLGTLEEA
jgi:RNA polymerase sigma factor (sigma-70 family)